VIDWSIDRWIDWLIIKLIDRSILFFPEAR